MPAPPEFGSIVSMLTVFLLLNIYIEFWQVENPLAAADTLINSTLAGPSEIVTALTEHLKWLHILHAVQQPPF